MKRGEKSGEGTAEKREKLGEKLRKEAVVGKRGGQRTPVIPPWRLFLAARRGGPPPSGGADAQEDSPFFPAPPPPVFSARKLAATLWELHHYRLPLSKMQHGVPAPAPRLRHRHHRDPSPSSPDLGSASSLRKHVAASMMQHHRTVERNNHALRPVSPGSYGSSMEVAPYNPAATPTSSVEFRGRIRETGYRLKTSAELIKVLNRIWSLEEQHASNMLLVKGLKKELDHARARIKELVRDQQADRHEIQDLRNQIAEDKLVRKSKEQDRISAVREELEDERKLRKRSEGLHRKLARELYEAKITLASALKELESERKSRKILEDLCDEFALGIRDYEQDMNALRQKLSKEWVDSGHHDRLILSIAESWLNERMQMKQEEAQHSIQENTSMVDKFSSELETFLRSKQSGPSKKNDDSAPSGPNLRRSSLESMLLHAAASAPQDAGDEVDSAGSDSHCFELNRPSIGGLEPNEQEPKENQTNKIATSQEKLKGYNPTGLQVKFEEQSAEGVSGNKNKTQVVDTVRCKPREGKSELCEITEEGDHREKNIADRTGGSKSSHLTEDLLRSNFLLSEARNMHFENNTGIAYSGSSGWRRNASPVRQWTAKIPSEDLELPESSSKLPPDLKDNTLKAKLLEARTKGQRSRSRLKASKVPF